jgi:hypothetical protein
MIVCCQNLTLVTLITRSALSMLLGALFKKIARFLNTPRRSKRSKIPRVNWIHLGGQREWWGIIVHVLFKFNVPKTAGYFLTGCAGG